MDDLETRLDALFAGPTGEFIAVRNALAKELKAAGEAEEADRVAALRRPTKIAAELNRLARDEPEAVAALIAAEEALAAAQAALLAGKGDAEELGSAVEAEGRAITALSSDPAVRAGVQGAARRLDEREELRRGRLSRDPEPDFGAALLSGAPPPPAPRPAKPRRAAAPPEPEPEPEDPDDEVAARRRAKAARERQEAALAEARELEESAAANAERAGSALEAARAAESEAEGARDSAAAAVARLRDELAAAQEALREREKRVRDAAAATRRAEGEAAQAERLVGEAGAVRERLAAEAEDEGVDG